MPSNIGPTCRPVAGQFNSVHVLGTSLCVNISREHETFQLDADVIIIMIINTFV